MSCTLNDPEWKQCCCNCEFHKPTHEHCTTNDHLRELVGECICPRQNGWACCPPGSGRIYINWPGHSVGCEMYTAKKNELESENKPK